MPKPICTNRPAHKHNARATRTLRGFHHYVGVSKLTRYLANKRERAQGKKEARAGR